MDHTSHLNLNKPAYTEDADIGPINLNMDTIDNAIYQLQQKFPSTPLPINKGGTNATTAENARTQLGAAAYAITANMGTINSLPVTKTVTGVRANMKVCQITLGNPNAFASNLTVNTSYDTVTISGTLRSGSSSSCQIMFVNNTDVTGASPT